MWSCSCRILISKYTINTSINYGHIIAYFTVGPTQSNPLQNEKLEPSPTRPNQTNRWTQPTFIFALTSLLGPAGGFTIRPLCRFALHVLTIALIRPPTFKSWIRPSIHIHTHPLVILVLDLLGSPTVYSLCVFLRRFTTAHTKPCKTLVWIFMTCRLNNASRAALSRNSESNPAAHLIYVYLRTYREYVYIQHCKVRYNTADTR